MKLNAFLARPTSRPAFFLAYGTDAGLVREVADRLVARFAGSPPDPLAHTSINAADLGSEPGRLADEARAPSCSAGVAPCGCVAPPGSGTGTHTLLADMPDAVVVLEAGNLTRDDALRKLAEKAKNAGPYRATPTMTAPWPD